MIKPVDEKKRKIPYLEDDILRTGPAAQLSR